MLNGLDLFSGIGGLTLALAPWVRPVAYCEIDRYAQSVLLSRMADQVLPTAPIWDDVSTLSGADWPWWFGDCDIIYGGFPCQDLSIAGNGAGLDGERSGLFFEIVRLVRECRPRFVFLENVPVLAVRGLDRVLLEFDALGYDARWTIVSAAEVGAPHLRDRIWILAHANGTRCEKLDAAAEPVSPGLCAGRLAPLGGTAWWATEPSICRVADGIPARVDRVRGLGNSVVPAAAREAFMRLGGFK